MNQLNLAEASSCARGHFRLDIYEGDIRKAPLSLGHRALNVIGGEILLSPQPRIFGRRKGP